MIRKRTTKMLGTLLALVSLVGFATIFAGTFFVDAAQAEAQYQIELSPATLNLKLKPGETVKTTLELKNTGAKAWKFVTDVAPYGVKDENYTTDFESDTKYTELSDWAELSEDDGTLNPGESKKIVATITVPEDAKSGGQYAAFLAQFVDTNDSEALRGAATLVYAEIEGEVDKGGKILENKIDGFLFKPPIRASSLVENSGNVHQNATYVLEVKSFFSGDVVYSNAENPTERTILPETRRANSIDWEDSPKLGVFRVKQTVSFAGETAETEKLVILCPVWLLFIAILVLICVVFWIISRVGSRKSKSSKTIKEEKE